jgi:hypothetical protein
MHQLRNGSITLKTATFLLMQAFLKMAAALLNQLAAFLTLAGDKKWVL